VLRFDDDAKSSTCNKVFIQHIPTTLHSFPSLALLPCSLTVELGFELGNLAPEFMHIVY
jgi:hypothetical protein